MAGTSRKRQETSESPRSRAKSSRGRAGSSWPGKKKQIERQERKTGGAQPGLFLQNRLRCQGDKPPKGSAAGTGGKQFYCDRSGDYRCICGIGASVFEQFSPLRRGGRFLPGGHVGNIRKAGVCVPRPSVRGKLFYASNRGNRRAAIKLAAPC